MPLEDKVQAPSGAAAPSSGARADTVAGTQNPTPVITPAEASAEDSSIQGVVPISQVSEENSRIESGNPHDPPPPPPCEGGARGGCRVAVQKPEDSVAAKAAREEPTVAQDDRAKKAAQWKSLETLHPIVPGYEILKKLGQGTYGVVWHAREEGTGIEVAIKFFAHGTGDQWQTLQAEVKQLAMLHADPGIVHLIDVEPEATPPYFIMDYAEHGSLAKRLESGPLPLAESFEIFRRVVEALAYVHAKGIRHCDLKPGNILLDARKRPKVADFGQAHLSSDASPALGTFFYMAPEQADIKKQIPDTRWDVYGLGALLYAMVTGKPPRADSSLRTRLEKTEQLAHRLEHYRDAVAHAAPVTQHRQVRGMDRPLADIISLCLEVEPDKRFHDANAILEALQRRQWNRQQRPLLLFGLAAPLLLLLALGWIGWSQAVTAVADFRDSQQRQVKADCKTAARLIQSVIRNKLLEQADRVKRVAEGDKVRAALGVNQQVLRYEARLLRAQALLDESRDAANVARLRTDLEYLGRNGFESWALVDRHGDSLVGDVFGDAFVPRDRDGGETEAAYEARRKKDRYGQEENFGKDFSWRKYFNGERDFYERNGDNGPAIRTPCVWPEHPALTAPKLLVTDPYLNKRKAGGLSIGVSAPVYVEDERDLKTLAGIFLGNISVRALHKWLTEAEIKDGHAVVLDAHNHCLFHTAEIDAQGNPDSKVIEAIRPQGKRDLPQFVFEAPVEDASRKTACLHFDPVMWKVSGEKRLYLSGSIPIIGTLNGGSNEQVLFRWTALVEQDFDATMEPVEKIIAQMTLWGGIKLGTACLLLLGMWAWLLSKLRRPEKAAHA